MFVGVFTELLKSQELPGYETPTKSGNFFGAIRKMVNPGVVFGKNASLGKRWYLDLYVGWKYKFIRKTEKYIDSGAITYVVIDKKVSGFRIGVNLCYAF